MQSFEAVLLGAGQRGRDCVGKYALQHPDELRFIAVAEPNEERRKKFADDHHIDPENCFSSYEELLSRSRMAPLCFNTTMDKDHLPSSLAALDLGYHLFLEKPIADTVEGGVAIVRAAESKQSMVQICHPLRYSAFYQQVKSIMDESRIGELISLSMEESVGYWHFAHSFVRGNWGNRGRSGPLIVTKCCHDMDLACWLVGSPVKTVSSFGNLRYFNSSHCPEGAPKRCTEGCPVEDRCLYYAPLVYGGGDQGWPASAVSVDPSPSTRRKALEEGPYGRCVFQCDNDVVDHQVVNVEFENGVTLCFAVRAHTEGFSRFIHLGGAEGALKGSPDDSCLSLTRFRPGIVYQIESERIPVNTLNGSHGGGDIGVIRNFLRCCRENDYESLHISLLNALEGHLLAFAADEARVSQKVVRMPNYRDKLPF